MKRGEKFVRRPIILGDGNEIFLVVEQGLEFGDEVALSPQAVMAEIDETFKPVESEKKPVSNVTATDVIKPADEGQEGIGDE